MCGGEVFFFFNVFKWQNKVFTDIIYMACFLCVMGLEIPSFLIGITGFYKSLVGGCQPQSCIFGKHLCLQSTNHPWNM